MKTFFYDKPRLLVLALLLILVGGLSAYTLLPRREDPEMVARFGMILTRMPGATAFRVESLVTEKIEDELRELEEIKDIYSVSRSGISIVNFELLDRINDPTDARARVRDKLDEVRARLPAAADRPELKEAETEAFALIMAVSWNGKGDTPYGILHRLAEELEDELRSIPGTRLTEIHGAPEEEIVVELDADRLMALGLDSAEVARQLRASDAKVAAGQLRSQGSDLLIEVHGEFQDLESIRSLPLRVGKRGQTLFLSDIAKIHKGIRTPASNLALIAGHPGIAVSVRVQRDRRLDHWAKTARSRLAQFAEDLPRGMSLETLFDQSRYTEHRLESLATNFLLGALAVTLVIFLMMGWRSALLVGLALPLTSLMVLAGMRAMGIPLHQMSVTGLIIALGLLIDNAIVVVDEVKRRLEGGSSARSAIAKSVSHLAMPLAGSTITTMLAFMPLVLMPGGAGDFVGPIAMSVILALGSSLFLSLTILPALAGLMEKRQARQGNRSGFLRDGFRSVRLSSLWERTLAMWIARPWAAVGFSILLPMLGFLTASSLQEQFFPPAERDQFQVQLELPAASSLARTEKRARELRRRILSVEGVREVHWFLGTSAPRFYYNLMGGRDDAAFFAQALVQLDSPEGASEKVRQIQGILDEAFPQAQSLALQLEQGPPFDAPVELRLYGPDLDKLAEIGERARSVLVGVEGVRHTRTSFGSAKPKLEVVVDEEKARQSGMGHREIARQLQDGLEGHLGGSILEGREELPVRVRLENRQRGQVENIASLDLRAPDTGEPVPLEALGSLHLVSDVVRIPHRNGERLNTVQAFLEVDVLPSQALAEFRERLRSTLVLPRGYRFEFGGEAKGRNDAVGNLMASISVLVVLMIATLVLSFQSFRMAALIGVVALLSMGLSMLALVVFGQIFGFMAIVGTMGLVGVAINDSIVVLAALRENEAASRGDRAAILSVMQESTRHVVATTVTTVAGFLPLLLGGGGFWPPLAIAIAGGVTGATILALVLIPAAFQLVIRPRRAERPSAARHLTSLTLETSS